MPGVNVLLVEDNEADRILIREFLSDRPEFSIIETPTLEDARSGLSNDPIDVVLLDLGLPDAMGIEGLRKILKCPAPPPIIVLTGSEEYETTIDTLRGGAHDYLTKAEIGRNTVATAIDFTLERRRLEADIDEALAATEAPAGDRTPLQTREARHFARLMIQYMDILDRRIDALLYGTDPLDRADVNAIAEQLARLRASAADAVEIHHLALKQAPSRSAPQRARALTRASRSLLIDVLRLLLDKYR